MLLAVLFRSDEVGAELAVVGELDRLAQLVGDVMDNQELFALVLDIIAADAFVLEAVGFGDYTARDCGVLVLYLNNPLVEVEN